jgi:hypothetical protein
MTSKTARRTWRNRPSTRCKPQRCSYCSPTSTRCNTTHRTARSSSSRLRPAKCRSCGKRSRHSSPLNGHGRWPGCKCSGSGARAGRSRRAGRWLALLEWLPPPLLRKAAGQGHGDASRRHGLLGNWAPGHRRHRPAQRQFAPSKARSERGLDGRPPARRQPSGR